MLLEEEFAELLASGDDGAGSDGELLERVFLGGCGAELFLGLLVFAGSLIGPGEDFIAKDVGLRGPILVAGAVELIFIFRQSGNFCAYV